MNNLPSRLSIPAPDSITLDDIIAMYEALRPSRLPPEPCRPGRVR